VVQPGLVPRLQKVLGVCAVHHPGRGRVCPLAGHADGCLGCAVALRLITAVLKVWQVVLVLFPVCVSAQ
jgi:hypothetical protein